MSERKLAVVLLDALGPQNIYSEDMFPGFETIRERYRANGEVLGISTLPHTAQSNPMIWGGFINHDKFWVEAQQEDEWIDPSVLFEHRGHEHNRPDAAEYRNYERADYDETFVWDELDAAGFDPVALQVPIALPPFSYNAGEVDHESWFPDTEERMRQHIRLKPELVEAHVAAGFDFIATSIQMPDKWLHGIPEGKCDEAFVREESHVLDEKVADMIRAFEDNGYDWVFAGDHGSPTPGAMPVHEAKEILPRHRKEAVIFGSEGLDLPRYTSEMYTWMLDYFGVTAGQLHPGDVDHSKEVKVDLSESEDHVAAQHIDVDGDEAADEVMSRLENLGYK